MIMTIKTKLDTKTATEGVLWKKVFLNNLEILKENTCFGVSF